MNDKKLTLYYFSGTHWDREWYQPFQGFRFRLVQMVNELIEVLEKNPEFKVFHFDGQAIFLEDFLEIEPEKRGRLEKLIREGRLLVGPWYVMPDELLLSGESLIRNLQRGQQIAREFGGEPWKFGYICDIFGHTAQMPQIFNGFGIHYAALGRGTNEHTTPAFFVWQSPDGSSCITHKIEDYNGYGVFCTRVLGWDEERYKEIGEILPRMREYIEDERKRTDLPFVLVMDAMDHEAVHPETPEYIRLMGEMFPEAEIKHVNLEEMGRELEVYRDQMPVRAGELNETARDTALYLHLITHTLSSRYPLKKANGQCQTLLEKWMDPLVAIFSLRGHAIQKSYTDLAYRYLLQNHPHDSICGCSVDQVHKDMEYRFDQCRMLAEQVMGSFMEQERKRYPVDSRSQDRVLVLWNPLPYPRHETVTVEVEFPLGYTASYEEPFGYERKNSFRIYDTEGREVPCGLAGIKRGQTKRRYNQYSEAVDVYTLSLEVDLPACGTAEYVIKPSEKPSRYLKVLSNSEYRAANPYLKLQINGDGTVKIEDKKTGRVYDGLGSYLDDGEIGDGWYHVNPANDSLISSRGAACKVERIENGPARCVFRITQELELPERLESYASGLVRSDRTARMKIVSEVGLSASASHVDVKTTVYNNIRDHRIRLKLPTGTASDGYFVNQPFAFVERKAGIDFSTQDWKECEVPEKQMGGIVGRRNADGTGLAFVSAYGLHECAALADEEASILITLFRSFSRTKMTNGEEGGQIQGALQFSYCLRPLQPDTRYADLVRQQEALQTAIHTASFGIASEYHPVNTNYFELTGTDICVSAVKRPEEGGQDEIVIRCCNMSDRDALGEIRLFRELEKVQLADFEERPTAVVPHVGNRFTVTLGPWKIQTYRIKCL